MIRCVVDDGNTAVFECRRTAQYVVAWLVGIPLTIACGVIAFDFLREGSFLYAVVTALALPLLILITNMMRAPFINPQWIFTAIRKLVVTPESAVASLGYWPLRFRRSIPRADISKLVLEKQRWGRGVGFFEHFHSPGNIYALYLVYGDERRAYLVDNEPRNGLLQDEGRHLSQFLAVPFIT
jgi:hypothetical protein